MGKVLLRSQTYEEVLSLFGGFTEMKKIVTQKFGLMVIDSDSLLIPLLINLSEFNADNTHSKDRAGTLSCVLFL